MTNYNSLIPEDEHLIKNNDPDVDTVVGYLQHKFRLKSNQILTTRKFDSTEYRVRVFLCCSTLVIIFHVDTGDLAIYLDTKDQIQMLDTGDVDAIDTTINYALRELPKTLISKAQFLDEVAASAESNENPACYKPENTLPEDGQEVLVKEGLCWYQAYYLAKTPKPGFYKSLGDRLDRFNSVNYWMLVPKKQE